MPRPGRTFVGDAQAVSERKMPDVATVERWADGTFDRNEPDAAEGTWTLIHTGDGRVDLISDRGVDRTVAYQFDLAEPVAAVLPSTWDVRQDDRVTVADVVMQVKAVQRASYRAHLRVVGDTVQEV